MVPGVGLMHAPFALFPTSFPESKWKQACDLAPIFNELVDRVSLDAKFLQESLSRSVLIHCCSVIFIHYHKWVTLFVCLVWYNTVFNYHHFFVSFLSQCRTKQVDEFTSRLLDIHSKMLQLNKKEVGT